MIMETKSNLKSSMMAGNQSAIYQVESFLEESYLFRRNVLNGKTEFFCIKPEEEMEEECEEWWRVVEHSSPLAPPVFIGVSGESVKSEE